MAAPELGKAEWDRSRREVERLREALRKVVAIAQGRASLHHPNRLTDIEHHARAALSTKGSEDG